MNHEDYYQFDSLNGLEKFLIQTKLFDNNEIKKDIERENRRISKANKLGFNDVKVGCWLTKLKDKKIEYITNTRIKINNFKQFFENYNILKSNSKNL